jgi:glycyl-tRNA synthetase beta chain
MLDLDPTDVEGSLEQAAQVTPVVSRFFDDVMVIADDERVRGNRLRVLLDLRDRLGRLGDLSQIPR